MSDKSRRFYFNRREDWEPAAKKKYFSDRQLKVEVVENGIVLPAKTIDGERRGGVCDENFNFVAGYTRENHSPNFWCNLLSAYEADRKEINKLDEDVIFGGVLMGHWGHFILECLTSPPPPPPDYFRIR